MDTVSVGVDGVPTGHMLSGRSSMSDDGRFVVFSASPAFGGDPARLVDGDACVRNNCLYLRDRQEGRTTVVSSRSDGTRIPDPQLPLYFDISDDGRIVAFTTYSHRLVPIGERNPKAMLYLKHVRTGELEAIPTPSGGNDDKPLIIDAYQITRHGRYVVTDGYFPGGARAYVYVYDRQEDRWDQVGDPTISERYEAMSHQGHYVAVSQIGDATNLRVVDRATGVSRVVSRGPAPAEAHYGKPRFSGDGRRLFIDWYYYNEAGQLRSFHLYYRTSDLTLLGRVDLPDIAAVAAVSETGRYVVTNIPRRVYNTQYSQIGVYDRQTGELTLVTRSPTGEPANFRSGGVTDVSSDGRSVLFVSPAGNIAPETGDQYVPRPVFADDYNDLFVATLSR